MLKYNLHDARVRLSGWHILSNLKHLAQDNWILVTAIVKNLVEYRNKSAKLITEKIGAT
jgi:hypothetical protein